MKLIPFKSGNDYQYVDLEGKIIINPQFQDATVFREGLALVKTGGENGGYGFINEEGKFVINPTYAAATVFSDGLAWVVAKNGAPTAINKKGEIKFSLSTAERVYLFSEGLAAFSVTDSTGVKFGYVDDSGVVKISPQFEAAGTFSNGRAWVMNKEGKYGFIDNTGKLIISYQFDDVGSFSQGYASVSLKDKSGTIDEDGKYVVNPQFNQVLIDDGRLLVEIDNKWGWCDFDGKIIINPQFESAFLFGSSDLAAVQSGGKWGYIDRDGKFSINAQFENAFPFSNGVAVVSTGEQYGLINDKGTYVANPQFKDVPRDFVYFISSGGTYYGSVETDYFNINAITDRININAPEGITLNNSIGQIMQKLNLQPNDISKYGGDTQIFNDQKISNEATLSFGIGGNFYEMDENTWEYSIQPNKNPEGFYYKIFLSGRGAGKQDALKSAFAKKMTGMNLLKEGTYYGKQVAVYRDNNKYVVTEFAYSRVNILILNAAADLSSYINNIDDSVAAEPADYYPEAAEAAPASDSPWSDEEAEPPMADTTAGDW